MENHMTQQPMAGGWGQPPQQPQQGWGQPPAQPQYPAQQPQQGWGQPPAQQQYPAQQQNPWGGAPQGQPQGPAPVMAHEVDEADDFFSGGVKGEPGFDWGRATNQQQPGKTALGSNIAGTIIEMVQMQQTDMATKAPKFYPSGDPMMQVAITLQTALRGWQGIMPDQIPLDPATGQPKHPSLDAGLRRIYVKNDMKRAITEACNKVGQKPRKGGQLAVQLKGYEDRGKGNPMPLYDAVYQAAPDDGGTGGFFQASGPGQQVSQGQDTQPPQGYPVQQQQPAYQPPAGQGYQPPTHPGGPFQDQGQPTTPLPPGTQQVTNNTGQPEYVSQPGQQNPSSLGQGQPPQQPPEWATQQGPPPGQAPTYDGPNF